MALITCPECKKKISDTADSCPSCGYKLTSEKIADIKKEEQQEKDIGMALITCPECKKKISDAADSCPSCGYKLTSEKMADIKKEEQQETDVGTIGCGILGLVTFFILMISINDFPSNSETATPKVETRQEKIEKHFSGWDGSHYELTRIIKQSMNDPDSYEHVETFIVRDEGDYLVIQTIFRGKNGFGGIVKNWVRAKIDLNGRVIEIMSQGS